MGDRSFRDVGVLVNARAGLARRSLGLVERLRVQLPPNRVAVTSDPAGVEEAVQHFCDVGIDLLCVVGGDGTVTGTLTPLIEFWDDPPLPALCLLSGGTINTISGSLGASGAPDRAVARLLEHGARTSERRTVLGVIPGDGRPRYGMIFGMGVVARWLELYYKSRARGPAAAALGVARSMASIVLRGPLARGLFEPFELKLEADGKPVGPEWVTGIAAGTVRDIGLGFRPFFGAGQQPGRFHWIETASRGPGLMVELPAAALGTTLPGGPLHHDTAASLRLQLAEPQSYTVDGDLFPPVSRLEIQSGPELRFLAP